MKPGPASIAIGRMSCPLCHEPASVTTNKHGHPAFFCPHCRSQLQPRSQRGSLLLLGKVHEWLAPEAAAAMIEASEVEALYPQTTLVPGRLPPHLTKPPKSPPPRQKAASIPAPPKPAAPPAPPRKKSIWDLEL